MKIIICFPPLNSEKGCPTLGQNRQFQYFKEPTFIYPVVPAIAATLLKQNGFDVVWLDCLAQGISHKDFFAVVKKHAPDLIAFETKAPVIKKEWEIIDKLKEQNPNLLTVFFGDHVTALPKESFEHSSIDYVLTGGDYDFLLLNLCQHLQSPESIQLEDGIWMRKSGEIQNTGDFKLRGDLDSLPFIDRELTRWKDYAYKNGNYRRTPGTYIMSGRDCWWGKCTFCSWPQLYPKFRARSVKNVLDEIQHLVEAFQVREIMDDTGTFPVGGWLKEFCEGMIARGLHKKVTLDCNMRFGAIDSEGYKLMRKAGFRFLLFGIESANQETLNRIKKNLDIETIKRSCKEAREAGLYPHITIMFGYPWETLEDANNTFELGAWLLKRGYAYTMQSTVVIPYPRTPLFVECEENDWLTTENWNDYDMKRPVMKLGFPENEIPQLVQKLYRVSFSPEFIFRKILSIRELDDLWYFWRAFLKVIGHLIDFKGKRKK